MTLPLVPVITQFDGGKLASQNCTCASGARLMLYATGKRVTGSQVRAKQADQSGGTSIPDVMRALHNGWSFEPAWAAPHDSNDGASPAPAGKVAQVIVPPHLRELLDDDYMVLVQGDYGNLPTAYREQVTFRDDHAFTVDARRGKGQAEQAYVVDTIPRAGSGYKGRWIPWGALMSYAHGLAGSGRIYAAWARPLPDTSTEDALEAFSIPQNPSIATAIKATKLYATSDLKGTAEDIPAGHTKRYIGNPAGKKDVAIIGHDRSADVDGKSALYGRAADWHIRETP